MLFLSFIFSKQRPFRKTTSAHNRVKACKLTFRIFVAFVLVLVKCAVRDRVVATHHEAGGAATFIQLALEVAHLRMLLKPLQLNPILPLALNHASIEDCMQLLIQQAHLELRVRLILNNFEVELVLGDRHHCRVLFYLPDQWVQCFYENLSQAGVMIKKLGEVLLLNWLRQKVFCDVSCAVY